MKDMAAPESLQLKRFMSLNYECRNYALKTITVWRMLDRRAQP